MHRRNSSLALAGLTAATGLAFLVRPLLFLGPLGPELPPDPLEAGCRPPRLAPVLGRSRAGDTTVATSMGAPLPPAPAPAAALGPAPAIAPAAADCRRGWEAEAEAEAEAREDGETATPGDTDPGPVTAA